MINPTICWNNLLVGCTYIVNLGTDSTNAPFSNAWNGRTSRPALPIADANGDFQVTFTLTNSQTGYGTLPYGWGAYGGIQAVNSFIMGASRADPLGARFLGGNIKLEANTGAWVTVLDEAMVFPINMSSFFNVAAHTGTVTYRLTIYNQPPNQTVSVPEMFLGEKIQLGGIAYGFDPYGENTKFDRVEAWNGNTYDTVRFTKFTAKPSWDVMPNDMRVTVDFFREGVVEKVGAFWWCFDESIQHQTYIVKHKKGSLHFPIQGANHSRLAMDLEEVL